MLDTPSLITGNGADPSTGIAIGATLEVLLIIANVATAVVAYPVLKRESEMGAIGYVSARLVEAMFIAIGIVGALGFLLMRQEATATPLPWSGTCSSRSITGRSSSGPVSSRVSRTVWCWGT
jgi:hypothetical protein